MTVINTKSIQIPDKLDGGYVLFVYPLSELTPERFGAHRRLSVYIHKGVQCNVPNCRQCGTYLISRGVYNKKGKIMGIHYDIYSQDFVMMTVDHHIPRSKGGADSMDNKFPMCSPHNTKKGKIDPEIYYQRFTKCIRLLNDSRS